ncbi:MAG: HAMP domain-containing histidine kinase, partial [Gemmatimonadetes bacterium]|nr:HAMP domain-containing histidine kinase [Gemmatimonadota bacterium]
MTLAEFNARLSPQTALRDSALDAAAALQRVTRDAAARAAAGVTTAVNRQRTLSLVLSLAALLAASLVAWLARRRHLRNERLARAVREQTRLREESDRRRNELERVTESRARLMRGLSHDLTNPLGAADGFLQLLEEGVDDGLASHQRESVARARRSIHTALHLIESLLDLGRDESGRLDIQRVPTDLRAIARETAEEYRAQAAVKGLAIETELPDHLPPIQSDPWRIHEILGNLISNALKYTTHGHITVRVAESGSGGRPAAGHRVELAVRDTGPGIPPSNSSSSSRNSSGSSLGPRAAPASGSPSAVASPAPSAATSRWRARSAGGARSGSGFRWTRGGRASRRATMAGGGGADSRPSAAPIPPGSCRSNANGEPAWPAPRSRAAARTLRRPRAHAHVANRGG